jgi:hypothetical protein
LYLARATPRLPKIHQNDCLLKSGAKRFGVELHD